MAIDPNRQRVAIRYQADDGNFYSVVTSRNHAVAVGAVGALAADPPIPTKWKLRLVHGLQILGGNDRKVSLVVPLRSQALWQDTTTTFVVQPYGTFQITGRTGGRRTIGAPPFDNVPTPPDERVSINYVSENGSTYTLVTTRAHAAALGAPGAGNFPAFPDLWTPRHYGLANIATTGRDQKLVLVEWNPASTTWNANQAFSIPFKGSNYRTTGRIQENRPEGAPPFTP